MLLLPMRLPSVANQRFHWATKATQARRQRNAVALAMKSRPQRAELLELRAELARGGLLEVILMRGSQRLLDSDNLASSFKAVRDQVAAELGTDDGPTGSVTWTYRQNAGLRPIVCITIVPRNLEASNG